MALDAACQAVRTYTNQDLNLVRDDEVQLHGLGHREILLPQIPVLEVASISETDRDGDVEPLESSDWYVSTAGVLSRITSPYYWYPGIGNITVVYTHGWAVDEDEMEESDAPTADRMPSDLRMVAVQIAAGVYMAPPVSVSQVTLGDFSASFESSANGMVEPAMAAILDRYTVKGVA